MPRIRPLVRGGIAAALALEALRTLATPAAAAPQTFNTALPIARGELLWREQFLYRKLGGDRSAADRQVKLRGAISVLGYGAGADLALFAVLPVLDKELDVTPPGMARLSRSTTGIGDARLFARYTLFKSNFPGGSFRIAPFAGLELPTGDDDDRDRLGPLPPPLQLGSGSWDPFVGIVTTWQVLDFEVDASASYKLNARSGGFESGDETRLDASLQYRLWPRRLRGGLPGFLYGVLETNLAHQGRDRRGGLADPDSGGTSLMLSPGLQYVTLRWVVEAIVQLPVVRDPNGRALRDDLAVRAGFRIKF